MKAPIWNYYAQNKEDLNKAICNTCENQIGCKGGTTSALNNHLKIHHEIYKEYENTRKNIASSIPSSAPPNK